MQFYAILLELINIVLMVFTLIVLGYTCHYNLHSNSTRIYMPLQPSL